MSGDKHEARSSAPKVLRVFLLLIPARDDLIIEKAPFFDSFVFQRRGDWPAALPMR